MSAIERSDRIRHFERMPAFESVGRAALEWLADHVEERSFAADEELIEQGRSARDCYFLISGEVDIEVDGNWRSRCGPEAPEGELALLFRRPRSATVTAVGPVGTLVLHSEDFDAATREAPEVAEAIDRALRAYLATRFGHPSAPNRLDQESSETPREAR